MLKKINIEIAQFTAEEVLGYVLTYGNIKDNEFIKDIETYKELNKKAYIHNTEYNIKKRWNTVSNIEAEKKKNNFLEEISENYLTKGFWYCSSCKCFYSLHNFEKGHCPVCNINNSFSY